MKDVDLYLKVRHAVRIEGLSERAAARRSPSKRSAKTTSNEHNGYARRNFLVPIPVFESFAMNAHLLECCRRRLADRTVMAA